MSLRRERANDRLRRLSLGRDRAREDVNLHPIAARGVANQAERSLQPQAESLSEDSLGLLDHDARLKCLFQLRCTLAPEERVILALRHLSAGHAPPVATRSPGGE